MVNVQSPTRDTLLDLFKFCDDFTQRPKVLFYVFHIQTIDPKCKCLRQRQFSTIYTKI